MTTKEHKRLICQRCHEDRDLWDLSPMIVNTRGVTYHYVSHRTCNRTKYKALYANPVTRASLRLSLHRSKMKYAQKQSARMLARSIPLQPCEVCGTEENVHKHHEDYSKPLDVRFLCTTHHGERHREINAMRRVSEVLREMRKAK